MAVSARPVLKAIAGRPVTLEHQQQTLRSAFSLDRDPVQEQEPFATVARKGLRSLARIVGALAAVFAVLAFVFTVWMLP